MTRDSAAFTQGLMLPSHSYYEAVATQVEKSCSALEQFWSSGDRLLRQLQVQANQSLVVHPPSSQPTDISAKYERLR